MGKIEKGTPERRFYQAAGLKIEKREDGTNSRHITGYALVFNTLSKDLGGFQERIDPAALEGVDLSDVVALFNHDKNLILARTSANTLKLTVDKQGFEYGFDAPETTAGNDLLVSVSRGDVNGSSFAFITEEDNWEQVGDIIVRTITKFASIIDVSPVVFPAYDETSVAQRSMKDWKNEQKPVFKNIETTRTILGMYRK